MHQFKTILLSIALTLFAGSVSAEVLVYDITGQHGDFLDFASQAGPNRAGRAFWNPEGGGTATLESEITGASGPGFIGKLEYDNKGTEELTDDTWRLWQIHFGTHVVRGPQWSTDGTALPAADSWEVTLVDWVTNQTYDFNGQIVGVGGVSGEYAASGDTAGVQMDATATASNGQIGLWTHNSDAANDPRGAGPAETELTADLIHAPINGSGTNPNDGRLYTENSDGTNSITLVAGAPGDVVLQVTGNWFSTTCTDACSGTGFGYVGDGTAGNAQTADTLTGQYLGGNFSFEATLVDDTDADGISDDMDNCTLVANPDQRDTDADNIGNVCDPDMTNDCIVNFPDLVVYQTNFFQPGDLDTDNNGDGFTNFVDLAVVSAAFFGPPGPSASGCN